MDLTAFEQNLVVRPLRPEDFDAVVEIQKACFPRMKPWAREQFESQLARFPEGQLGVELDGALVASAASLIVYEEDHTDWHDWGSIADDGMISGHDPDGDTLYGIELQVHPSQRGMRLSRRLYDARKELCRRFGLSRIVIGGRIPGYGKHRETMSPSDYVDAVRRKQLVDPVLTAQMSNGFALKGLIPGYLPEDVDSAGFATHLEWVNLDLVQDRRRIRRHARTVRVALVQYGLRRIQSFEDFETQVEFFVDTAGDYKADFVVFPELFTLQLLSLVADSRPGTAARALAEFTPRFLELMGGLALRYNVNVIGGSSFHESDGRLLNLAWLFRRDGSIEHQAKIHITPSEERWWGVEGGSKLEVFDTDCGRIGIAVCYDVEFPELVRRLASEGADLLFVPYNTNDRSGHLRVKLCAQARAIENHLYVVTAGCVGTLPMVENADVHYAQSGVYTPCDVPFARDGIAAQASENIETIVVQDVDLELLRIHRRRGTTRNWRDRRTDLYRVRYADDVEV
jgi:predicted amidohydrolase/GNAT superfamily N-acetyltransferase